jgi:hypothetical protein
VALPVAAGCFRWTPSQVDGGNQGRILVLGIRGSAYRLRDNPKINAVFRDPGGKPGPVLGLLHGPAKEIALRTVSIFGGRMVGDPQLDLIWLIPNCVPTSTPDQPAVFLGALRGLRLSGQRG